MESKKLIQALGLATVLGMSAGAIANDEYRADFNNGPAFNNHPVFRESLRLMDKVNDRQERQLDRILNGFYERRISPAEFRRLMDEQREIGRMERAFLSDGVLTRFEFRRLNSALNAANRDIFRESHDKHRDGYGDGYGGGWKQSHGYGSEYR